MNKNHSDPREYIIIRFQLDFEFFLSANKNMSFLCCGKKVLKYLQHNTLDVTIMLAEKGNSCQSHSYKNESNFLEYKKSYLICIHKLGCQAAICNISTFQSLQCFTCFNFLHMWEYFMTLPRPKRGFILQSPAAKKPQPPR